jgi:hypothetical protein
MTPPSPRTRIVRDLIRYTELALEDTTPAVLLLTMMRSCFIPAVTSFGHHLAFGLQSAPGPAADVAEIRIIVTVGRAPD